MARSFSTLPLIITIFCAIAAASSALAGPALLRRGGVVQSDTVEPARDHDASGGKWDLFVAEGLVWIG